MRSKFSETHNFNLFALASIAALAFIANFLYSNGFLLYEDDWNFLLTDIFSPGSKSEMFFLFPQGRPVGFWIAALVSELYNTGIGPHIIYAMSCSVLILNGYIIYSIL